MKQTGEVIGGYLRQFLTATPFNTAMYSATSRTIAGYSLFLDAEPVQGKVSQFLPVPIQGDITRGIAQLLRITEGQMPEKEM